MRTTVSRGWALASTSPGPGRHPPPREPISLGAAVEVHLTAGTFHLKDTQ
jgi:hypothetical protein